MPGHTRQTIRELEAELLQTAPVIAKPPSCQHPRRAPWDCACSFGSCGVCHINSKCLGCGAMLKSEPNAGVR